MRVDVDTRPLRRWLATAAEPTAVLVACHEHEHLDAWRADTSGTRAIIFRLPGCLADAPPAALLEILAGGAVSVTGMLDGCAKPAGARRVLTRAGRIAAVVAAEQPIVARSEPPQTGPARSDPDRPGRFRRRQAPRQRDVLDARAMPVGRRALVGLSDAAGALDAHPVLRLLAVVRELLGGAPVPSELDDLPTGAALLAAADCCGSGVCVRTCPTQALTLTATELAGQADNRLTQFALSIDPALCIDCGQCVELCPESAMTRVGPLPWGQALKGIRTTLRVGIVEPCARCGMPSSGAGSLCAVCAFRTSEPFGSELPPGFVRASRG